MTDQPTVLIVGAGPAGLVLGNLLQARGVDTLVLERASREQVQTRARASFLGATSVRVLTEHGLDAGMLRAGRPHDTCAFRDASGEFELNHGKLGRGEMHTVYPQQNLVTDLIAEYLDRGGDLRFGVTVTDVDAETATADLLSLAAATGTDQESLSRLLRYLTTLGIVHALSGGARAHGSGFPAAVGHRRLDAPLALMYGGTFYESFAALTDAVRSGEESYAKVFGAHHFAHLAANPELAELFHQSMAASSAMFTELTRLIDFSAARTVVDVAGGNGELLSWDDTRCHTILTTCAANMPDHAELLVIERLLPGTGDTDSLAVPWDIHMLCNIGGRERTESHYRSLLADAGFELTATHPLPLDAYVLRARKTH